MSRYDPLRPYLLETPADQTEVRLAFRDLERIVGLLPASAHNHRPWWANDATRSLSSAWQQAGFRVQQVNLTAGLVVFARSQRSRLSADIGAMASRGDPLHPGGSTHTATASDDHSEVAAQVRMVAYLASQQWHLDRVADAVSREQDIDLLASKDGRILAVEVKGYPSRN